MLRRGARTGWRNCTSDGGRGSRLLSLCTLWDMRGVRIYGMRLEPQAVGDLRAVDYGESRNYMIYGEGVTGPWEMGREILLLCYLNLGVTCP